MNLHNRRPLLNCCLHTRVTETLMVRFGFGVGIQNSFPAQRPHPRVRVHPPLQ